MVFCQVSCWDAHVPVMGHKDPWALEKEAPSKAQWAHTQNPESVPKPKPSPYFNGGKSNPEKSMEHEILVVASKVKAYIKSRSGMNTSSSAMEAISDFIRKYADEAITEAKKADRKTVLDRDIEYP